MALNPSEWADGLGKLFKELGWERGLFLLFVGFLEWRLHRSYKRNLDHRQREIDRLERQNQDLLNRLTKLLDKKYGLKTPVKPTTKKP